MSFRPVFIAVVIAGSLVVAAFVIHSLSSGDRDQAAGGGPRPRRWKIRTNAIGEETSAVVHEVEGSRHVRVGVTCLDCHQSVEGQDDDGIPRVSPSPNA